MFLHNYAYKIKNELPKREWIVYCLFAIILLVAMLYYKVAQYDFVNFDDGIYVYHNYDIKNLSIKVLGKMFSHQFYGHYHPITMLSFAIQYQIFGLEASTYHTFNIIVHLLTLILVFKLIRKISGSAIIAIFVALIFGIHPMNVESVAWVAARGSTLYALFYVAALLSYLSFTDDRKKWKYYILFLFFFICALLTKSSAVTLPVLLVAIDFYKDRKINWKKLITKIPLFAMSFYIGILAIKSAYHFGSLDAASNFTLLDRFFLVSGSVSFYIIKAITPYKLCVMHLNPLKDGSMLPVEFYLSVLFLVGLGFAIYKSGKIRKEVLAGVLFFLITMSVHIQFKSVGLIFACERYVYLPYIGLIYALVVSVKHIINKFDNKLLNYLWFALIVIYIGYLGVSNHYRNKIWVNSTVLFSDLEEKFPDRAFSKYSVGISLTEQKLYAEAIVKFDESIKMKPSSQAYEGRASCKEILGDNKGAIEDYNKSIKLASGFSEPYNGRGLVKHKLRDFKGAIEDFKIAIKYNPNFPAFYENMANSRLQLNDTTGVCEDLRNAYKYGNNQLEDRIRQLCD